MLTLVEKKTPDLDANSLQGLLRDLSYLAPQLSDCLSGKSTRGMPGGRFVGGEGILEPRVGWLHDDARVRHVRAARKRNTLRPVFCVLDELDDDELRAELFPMDPITAPL